MPTMKRTLTLSKCKPLLESSGQFQNLDKKVVRIPPSASEHWLVTSHLECLSASVKATSKSSLEPPPPPPPLQKKIHSRSYHHKYISVFSIKTCQSIMLQNVQPCTCWEYVGNRQFSATFHIKIMFHHHDNIP